MLIESINELRMLLKKRKSMGAKIGFVPTMGYLHEGHLSLIQIAKENNDFVVVSIFVNPTQFAPGEDFETYPRSIDADYNLAIHAGADIIFAPTVNEMYPAGASTFVEVEGNIVKKLCGKSRPTHFRGVTTVVNKLFHIVEPHNAYFGQKDAQQCMVIKKMVRELHMDVNVVVCPIIRESDGLAMSSRNVYLSEEERRHALVLYESLNKAKDLFLHGVSNVEKIKVSMKNSILQSPIAEIDYIEVLDSTTLENIEVIVGNAIALVAVKFGNTRLLDNIIIEKEYR